MNDLELWERLTNLDAEEDLDGLAASLRSLGSLAPRVRAPFMGFIDMLLEHPHAGLRAAAVGLLSEVSGRSGIERIVASLDDDDAEVRAEAVRILREVSCSTPARWAHAMFHPRLDVRRLAVESKPIPKLEYLGAYLHADPELRGKAHAHAFPPEPAALIFDLLLRGHIDVFAAEKAFAGVQAPELRRLLTHSVRRTLEFVGTQLAAFESGTPMSVEGRDLFDLWCQLYWSHDRQRPKLLQPVAEAVLSKGPSLRTRAAFSILLYGQLHGHVAEALQLAVACHPAVLRSPLLTPELRRVAAEGLRLYRGRLPRIKPALVTELLEGPLVRRGDDFDVLLAALLSSLVPGRAMVTLRDIAGDDTLIRVALATPRAWSTLADLPEEPGGGPLWLLTRMYAVDPDTTARFFAAGAPQWLAQSVAAKHNAKKPITTGFDHIIAWLDPRLLATVLGELAVGGMGEKACGKLGDLLIPSLPPEQLTAAAHNLLATIEQPEGAVLLQRLIHRRSATEVAVALSELPTELRAKFCEHAESLVVPRETELSIATLLKTDADPEIASWALQVLGVRPVESSGARVRPTGTHSLTTEEIEAIATADEAALPRALAPALNAPSVGLTEALSRRVPPTSPSIEACVALVVCPDRLEHVSVMLDRFGENTTAFVEGIAPMVVQTWEGRDSLPPLGHAVLHRWEKHGFALLSWIDTRPGGLAEALRVSVALEGPLTRRIFWEGLASAVFLRRYRQNARMRAWCTAETMTLLVEHLDTEVGPSAARMLAAFHITTFAAVHLDRLRPRAFALMPDMDAATRRALEPWVRIDGLQARATPARRRTPTLGKSSIRLIRKSTDIAALVRLCSSRQDALVHEAALRLIELGGDGQRALADVLSAPRSEASMLAVSASVALWSDPVALQRVEALARDPAKDSQLRFRIAMALFERGQTDVGTVALSAVAAPSGSAWLTREDWKALTVVVPNLRTLATALAGSVHPNAYQRALGWLLESGGDDPRTFAALRMFLAAGTHRPTHLRLAAARRLFEHGHAPGFVVILREALDAKDQAIDLRKLLSSLDDTTRERTHRHAVRATLLGGADFCTEARCLSILRAETRAVQARTEGLEQLLLEGYDEKVRATLSQQLSKASSRALKLGQVAQVFAWGVRKGRELSGRMFSVHMTDRRQDLGYTRMTESTIYVSPLPMLRGDRHGRDVVEALILHEYGHHLYHRDAKSQRIWHRAHKEGIGSVLNLVADEHLERRLRAMEATYGDRLKRLAAYAFQHTNRELQLTHVLDMLQASAFEALSTRPLGVAFDSASVEVDSGLVLRELDRRGHPFARFVRAMRMGLGNRHGDPLLDRALALFKGDFRHKDMRGLYEIAVELSLMYGTHSDLAKTYGGHESLEWDGREGAVHGSGISDTDVQQEVERILRPPSASSSSGGPDGKPGRLQINVGPDTDFVPITKVERQPIDRARHRAVARDVRRHAMRLRQYFEELGLTLVPRGARLRGRSFDRTRVRAVVTRRDPRMLVARELEVQTDLFIGVVIDCSGSMASGQSMEKAHRFGVLLAEASRGLAGVDARFFGFTDRQIFDAGNASACAVTSLEATGGNNDAAGLLHAAEAAAASRRKAKLLVMISDGLPTECSVDALRNLVQQLTRRRGILCAQVAVRPLTEVCFPDYIELLDPELDRAVRRFGEIITNLARRALGR